MTQYIDDPVTTGDITSVLGRGNRAVKPGTREHFLSRWNARKGQWSPEEFIEKYNKVYGAKFTRSMLPLNTPSGLTYGTREHLAARWEDRKADGWSLAEFLAKYNKAYGTRYAAKDITRGAQERDRQLDEQGRNDPANRDAFASLKDTLDRYGLGTLGDWLWKQILDDVPESEIFIKLRQTDQYKARFPGMDARLKAGLRAMTEEEYIRAEEGYRTTLRGLGVDPARYDKPDDFLKFFNRDLSVNEVNERGEIWRMVSRSPETTARIKGLFKTQLGMANVNATQLYQMLVENDSPLLKQLNASKGLETLSMSNLKETLKRAFAQEAATFRGGGGQYLSNQGLNVGLTGAATERFS